MTEIEIEKNYNVVKDYYLKYLKAFKLTLPELKNSKGFYVKDSLVLAYLAKDYPHTHIVSKEALTQFYKKILS